MLRAQRATPGRASDAAGRMSCQAQPPFAVGRSELASAQAGRVEGTHNPWLELRGGFRSLVDRAIILGYYDR